MNLIPEDSILRGTRRVYWRLTLKPAFTSADTQFRPEIRGNLVIRREAQRQIVPEGRSGRRPAARERILLSYRFAKVFDGAFLGVTLTDAAWQVWALCYPKTILTRMEEHLSHKV